MSDFSLVQQALAHLTQHPHVSLEKLALKFSLAPTQFHKLFVRYTGVTPKDFAQHLTLVEAKQLLKNGETVLGTAHDVGLSGGGRLHDLFVGIEKTTPGEYKTAGIGLTIFYAFTDTVMGPSFFAKSERGLVALRFGLSLKQALAELKTEYPSAALVEDAKALAIEIAETERRLAGQVKERLSFAPRGTAFQLKVWEALLLIPEGQVTTYGALAKLMGDANASRAIGGAVGANPIALLIPCHRVIQTSGALGGYRWGVERKTAILSLEHTRKS